MDKATLTNPEGEGRQEQGSLPLLTHFRTLRCGKCICKRLTLALAFSKVYTLTSNELERFFCQRYPCSLASLHSSKIIDQRTSFSQNLFSQISVVCTLVGFFWNMESEENYQKRWVSLLIVCNIFKLIHKIPEVLRCFIFYDATQKYDFFLYAGKNNTRYWSEVA